MERSDTEDNIGERGDKSQRTNHDGDNTNSKVKNILHNNLAHSFTCIYTICIPPKTKNELYIPFLFSLERKIVSQTQEKIAHFQKVNQLIMNITTFCTYLVMLHLKKLLQHIKN